MLSKLLAIDSKFCVAMEEAVDVAAADSNDAGNNVDAADTDVDYAAAGMEMKISWPLW